ncbi:MAG: hypothetical protein U5J63_11350 [Fodinibius sp.]|nr:hypothetical protein [Fodinibius sp.]
MRRLLLLLLSITTLFMWSCTETTTGGGEEELQPLDFTTAPSSELSDIVQNTPGDFTWPFYNDNLTIGLDPEPETFEGEIVLSVFQVQNGEVTNRLTSEPVDDESRGVVGGLVNWGACLLDLQIGCPVQSGCQAHSGCLLPIGGLVQCGLLPR